MNPSEAIVEGTLQPDGTLVLDAKPNLPPGRVTVVLRQEAKAPPPQDDWFQFLVAARKRMEEAGCGFMNDREVQTHIEWLREAEQIDELLRQSEDQSRGAGQP
ncbi:MAG TPA: hypothetical protein VG826_24450 [Pirellulales bacterium]|nr:hypothetical protein [Pirellulales bacterium]